MAVKRYNESASSWEIYAGYGTTTSSATSTSSAFGNLSASGTASINTLISYGTASFGNNISVKGLTIGGDTSNNVIMGTSALANNVGSNNIAIGASAIYSASTIANLNNTAIGNFSFYNSVGQHNTAIGDITLTQTTAADNVAIGYTAMQNTISGDDNVAIGVAAMQNAKGAGNVAIGRSALSSASTNFNTVIGKNAGSSITTGSANVIIGSNTGTTIATAHNNIIIADGAGNIVITASGTSKKVSIPGTASVAGGITTSSIISTASSIATIAASINNLINYGTASITASTVNIISGSLAIGTSASPAAALNVVAIGSNALIDTYDNTQNPSIILRRARNTEATASPVLSGNALGTFGFRGYGTSSWSAASRAAMVAYAAENWTDIAQGSYFTFETTPIGSTTRSEAMRITDSGSVFFTDKFGYIDGSGSVVTQATSKSTRVNMSKITGEITTTNSALSGSTTVSFTMGNNTIDANDIVLVNHVSGGTLGAYNVTAAATATGSATFWIRNLTTGSLAEALKLRYSVFKSASA